MSATTEEGLRSPRRSQIDTADEGSAYFTFTPCTRLSRMAIDSQSIGLGRIRSSPQRQQLPVTNFNQKLMSVLREESNAHHPNLDMCLSSQGISMYDKSKDILSFSEDEDSDEGDLFSSSLCIMASPERPFTRESIFDDEMMLPTPTMPQINCSLFNEDDNEMMEQDDVYDPSNAWLSCIFHDTTYLHNNNNSHHKDNEEEVDKENRPPRIWRDNKQAPSTQSLRIPLSEIEDTDDLPTKKKMCVSQNGTTRKIRLMRTLSPPRFTSKQKDH
ncbi:hypothetical protein A0J61_10229 [Choanephora cucurbitarum]|uniref:Uncharacterized protein n=1 Tax=Choanephora cucurbitarum TaxID=101091 RepID=A0A1C7MY42_9FUNG|nr:hypothetical protein A0J61_10229 [Choanephora cucurbitarum]